VCTDYRFFSSVGSLHGRSTNPLCTKSQHLSLNLSIKSRQDSYNMHAPLGYDLYYSLISFTPKCTTRCAVASRQIKLWKWWVGDFLDWSETQSDLNSAITKVMFKYDRRERMLPSHALSFTMIWGFQWEEFSN
jgi:hypothetical protein